MAEIPVKLGKYEIRRELGRGAMGIVYEGWDPMIDRRVAMKTVRKEQLERSEGVIVLSLDDPILSLVLREKLGERGYTVTSCPAEKIRYLSGSSYKAMIVDSGKISGGLIGEFDLQDADGRGRVIVICGESENAVFPGPAFRQLSMPFEIDQVIGHIEA